MKEKARRRTGITQLTTKANFWSRQLGINHEEKENAASDPFVRKEAPKLTNTAV